MKKILVAVVAFALIIIFVPSALLVTVSSALHGNGGESKVEADYDPEAPIDNVEAFSCTFYYPDSPQDKLGGGRITADGGSYWRDKNKPATENLYLNTSDGRTIQGSIAVPQPQYQPLLPLGSSPTTKLSIPGYNRDEPAEIHDHFGHVRNKSGGWFECDMPSRIDIAVSGPEEEAQVRDFWKAHNSVVGNTFDDPNPMNRGDVVQCVIESSQPDLPPGTLPADFDSLSASRQQLLTLAYSKIGCPYVHGDAGPTSFDCSGFVLWLYQQIHNSRPTEHYTVFQCRQGTRVNQDQILPGDAVYFYGSTEPPGHVGIYLGNDKFIHAPHTGDVVKISGLSAYVKNGGRIFCYTRFMDPDKDVPTGESRLERSRLFMEVNGFIQPLRDLAEYNVESAERNGMDFRMFLVCAVAESSGGRECFHKCNPIGFGQRDFASWQEAVDTYYATIAGYGFGRDAYQIFRKYRGADNGYAENCMQLMNTI